FGRPRMGKERERNGLPRRKIPVTRPQPQLGSFGYGTRVPNGRPVALFLSVGFGVRCPRRSERNRSDKPPAAVSLTAATSLGAQRDEEDGDERTHRGRRDQCPAAGSRRE